MGVKYAMLGHALRRIRKFCDEYDTDAKGKELVKAIEKDFTSDGPADFLIVLAIKDGEPVGHLLAEIANPYGPLVGCIRQYEVDEKILTVEQIALGLEVAEKWIKQRGAARVRIHAVSESRARLFSKYGFERLMTTLGKDI